MFTFENILYLKAIIQRNKDEWYSETRERTVNVLPWDFVGELVDWLEDVDVQWKGGDEFIEWCNNVEIGDMPEDLIKILEEMGEL